MDKFLTLFRNRKLGIIAAFVAALLFLVGNIAASVETKSFSVSAFVITLFVIGLLALVGVGIYFKKRKVAEIASSVTIGYMGIFVITKYAGFIKSSSGIQKASAIFFVLGGFCFLGALVFIILRAFGVIKNYFSFVSSAVLVFCAFCNLIAVILYISSGIAGMTFGGVVDIIALVFIPISLAFTVQDQEA